MSRPKRVPIGKPVGRRTLQLGDRWQWLLTAIALSGVAVVVAPQAQDVFRLPKDSLFIASSVVLCAVFGFRLLRGSVPSFERGHRWVAPLCLTVVLWTIVCGLMSTNAALSAPSVLFTALAAAFFLSTVEISRTGRLPALALVLAPASLNAILVILQESGLWSPFRLSETGHLASTALIGNPNDVGAYLAGPALAAIALTTVTSGLRRVASAVVAMLLIAGVLVSQTLTAIAALSAGVALLVIILARAKGVVGLLILMTALGIAFSTYDPLRSRAANLVSLLREHDYNALSTYRLTAFTAAGLMFRDHPLVGVGPGTYGWNYFPYKLEAERRYPSLAESQPQDMWIPNFHEVHNDHLEILAETGAPGYAIFLCILVVLASRSWRLISSPGEPPGTAGTEEAHFSKRLSLPLAGLFFVLTLAQFPLQLSATLVTYLGLGAFCVAWQD